MRRVLVGLVLLLAAQVGLADSVVYLRDAQSGVGLAGELTFAELDGPVAPVSAVLDELLADGARVSRVLVERQASFNFALPTAVRVDVPGYKPLHTVLRPAQANRGWTLMLDPLKPRPMAVAIAEDRLMISGWVIDAAFVRPVAGAEVQVSHSPETGRSDANGYFEFEVDAPVIDDGQPEPFSVSISHPDFPDWHQPEVLAGSGGVRLQVHMGGPEPQAGVHRQLQDDPVWPDADPGARLQLDGLDEAGDSPPATITVGFGDAGCTQSCCTGSCEHACTFSLEEYTRRGLPKEWIASWAHDALAAGAVAYRSYGAWHVFNPPAHGAYDLCSSACCQVNEPGTVASTNQATATTSGLMLVHTGEVFRSEYSSQNNCLVGDLSCTNIDLSCGDGFVGSPAADWPCLQDDVGLGQDCFGHGRGMSQRGNHYWTQESPPRNWKWQLNHYYNASGNGAGLRNAFISQVLVIDEVRVIPEQAGPGTTITLELDVRNLAAETHGHVLIGASLRQPPGPFIDDPSNDQPISLPPGSSTVQRLFEIPPEAPEGSYDVYASLFIDIDQDQSVSSNDLAQHLVIRGDALWADEEIFADRFE